MAKTKVKRLNPKEEKINPFNFRFNKAKHKLVNEGQQRVNRLASVGKREQLRSIKNSAKRKAKDNAQYMAEMFDKKRLAQAERDKTENLRDKVDNQFNELKSAFLSKEFARKEPASDGKQIDSYDLILNDLLVNGGQRQAIKEAR